MYIIYRNMRIRNSTHALRKIECHEILGIDLLEDVNKLRYIDAYYNGLTVPNDYKDEDISATNRRAEVSIYWKDQNI